jgi:hypothetical protein
MQINVKSDNHVRLSDESIGHFQEVLGDALGRFAPRLTRVEAHLSDENSRAKGGDNDLRCALEARLAGLQPLAVTASGGTLEQAVGGAADKLVKMLDRTLQRQDHPRGHKALAEE